MEEKNTSAAAPAAAVPDMLLYGVNFNGVLHFDYAVRIPVMRDIYDALDETEEVTGSSTGGKSDIYYRMALLKRTITKLGDIPADDITTDLLLDELLEEDYSILDAAQTAAKKKRRELKNAADPSGK